MVRRPIPLLGMLLVGLAVTGCTQNGPTGADQAVAPPTGTSADALDPAAPVQRPDGQEWYPPAAKDHLPTDGSVGIAVSGKAPEAPAGSVNATGSAEFFTPDCKTSCVLAAGSASCSFTTGFRRDAPDLPSPLTYCVTSTGISGVTLGPLGNAYRCGHDGFVEATPRTPDTAWAGEEPTLVTAAGSPRAALPVGRGITLDGVICVTREDGVACGSTKYGSGFTMTAAGITFYGTKPADHSQYG